MSILIGIGIVTTVTTFYLGRKGWHALHKAVGITPGVLIYQDDYAPLSLVTLSWEQLNLNKKHLKSLSDQQLRQLKRIDNKVSSYQAYQAALQAQHKTPAITEAQFVLNKMLQTRLPDMLASHHHFISFNTNDNGARHEKKLEADALLQKMLDNIEQRLDELLAQIEGQHLQDLRVMDRYIDSHDQ
ncbi:hypothetical protein BTW00_04040 [Psychrobacter sp. C 20.9]|uniref:hypothetical protein n=1 Tax=Psychrobacter sp. C 20.9 TaxID=1926477 RepID=UPI000946FF5A|nr:hypothetical protein [Psychrobacter sp. C 20.9]OLF37274.1 hypothetical protein BTW00_04040 [Psychrobacter sp. C 20.9]